MKHLLAIITTAILSMTVLAGDWTQFRGPNGAAFSSEKGIPVNLDETKNLRWKVKLPGRGLSCPVIAEGRVFVTACSGYQQRRLHVLCFDVKKGKMLWERQFTATGSTACHPTSTMAAPTPVTDGKRVFALFATGDLAALDRDGNLLWYRSLVGDYPNVSNQVGMASSPVLHDNVLLLPMDNADDSFLAGVDAKTGKNLWKVKQLREINWATPTIRTTKAGAEAIFQTRKDVTARDPKTGKELWSFRSDDVKLSSVGCPLVANGLVYSAGGPYVALKPNSGAAGKPNVVWQSPKLRTGYTSPLYHDGKIYGLAGVGVNCLDATTGKEFWEKPQRVRGKFWASPILVNDKLYVVDEKGTLTIIQTGKEPKVVAKHEFNDTILATPSVADGAIFFRSDKQMWCFSER